MKIKDHFEIKDKHETGHESGLVIVLDELLSEDPSELIGRMADIQVPGKGILSLPIHEARHHGTVTSLFFRGVVREDIPLGCEIIVAQGPVREFKASTRSIAS
jgi:hypothetical protein